MDTGAIAAEVAHAAATTGWSAAERATAMLEPLRRVLPYDGAWLAVLDQDRRAHHSLVSTGWDRRTAAYLDGPVLVEEIEQLGMSRSLVPLRRADFPTPLEAYRSWSECLVPAGFHEGLGMCLVADDGRQVGFVGLFTHSDLIPSDEARDLLAALGPTIAQAIDPRRSALAAARTVRDATAAVVLTRAGDIETLPGLPGHPVLRPGSPVLTAACETLEGPQTTFLAPTSRTSIDPTGLRRVTALRVPDEPGTAWHRADAVVALSPCGPLDGLTRRELEVLGLLIAGHHNTSAAHRLAVTPRTIATHVEHILTKLDADSRALAAVRAQRRGLFIPPQLLPTAAR